MLFAREECLTGAVDGYVTESIREYALSEALHKLTAREET